MMNEKQIRGGMDQAFCEVQLLRAIVRKAATGFRLVETWAKFTHDHWDNDRDSKVGKCLKALSGCLPQYAPDTDVIRSITAEVIQAEKALEGEAGEQKGGHLEVGINEQHEVLINLDRDRTGHIVFSPEQARQLAAVLTKKAAEAEATGNAGPANRCQDDSPWADPDVKRALRDGRDPSDIALLICPKCGILGYYNEGSHFCCRMCNETWAVLADGEDPVEYEGWQTMCADEVISLADFEDGAPDGYGGQ